MSDYIGRNGDDSAGPLPGWLYPVSVIWGGCIGILFYVCGRFEYWFTYGFATLDERPAFWDAWAIVCFLLVGALSAAYFALALKRTHGGRSLLWIYAVGAVALPLLLWTSGVVTWTLNLSQPALIVGLYLWLLVAVPVSLCMLPVGVASGVSFSVLVARSTQTEGSRQG